MPRYARDEFRMPAGLGKMVAIGAVVIVGLIVVSGAFGTVGAGQRAFCCDSMLRQGKSWRRASTSKFPSSRT